MNCTHRKYSLLGHCLLSCCVVLLAAASSLAAEVTFTGDRTGAELETMPASKSLLKAPADVTGDFDVAKTPPKVRFAVFPGQWKGARLWSSWGDATFASDGNFYTSVGDHAAPHGTAYVYRVNPENGKVDLVVDYNKLIGIKDETKYTPGKIHGGLVDGGDGWLYFFGYRGSVRRTGKDTGYQGDWLLRFNLASGKTENLGIPVAHCSVPVLLGSAATKSLYGLAVPGQTASSQEDRFFRYDLEKQKLVTEGGPTPNMSRAMVVTDDGRAYYSYSAEKGAPGVFVRYNPKTNKSEITKIAIPSDGQLRAASRPNDKGVSFCMSRSGELFAFDTKKETVKALGPLFVADPLYTATCKLDPSQRYLYYLPGAHGKSNRSGTPVLQYDTQTGRRKVIAFLNDLFRKEMNYNLGGTYGIALNGDGSQLMINFNGAPLGAKQPDFELCSVVVLEIPASER